MCSCTVFEKFREVVATESGGCPCVKSNAIAIGAPASIRVHVSGWAVDVFESEVDAVHAVDTVGVNNRGVAGVVVSSVPKAGQL